MIGIEELAPTSNGICAVTSSKLNQLPNVFFVEELNSILRGVGVGVSIGLYTNIVSDGVGVASSFDCNSDFSKLSFSLSSFLDVWYNKSPCFLILHLFIFTSNDFLTT